MPPALHCILLTIAYTLAALIVLYGLLVTYCLWIAFKKD